VVCRGSVAARGSGTDRERVAIRWHRPWRCGVRRVVEWHHHRTGQPRQEGVAVPASGTAQPEPQAARIGQSAQGHPSCRQDPVAGGERAEGLPPQAINRHCQQPRHRRCGGTPGAEHGRIREGHGRGAWPQGSAESRTEPRHSRPRLEPVQPVAWLQTGRPWRQVDRSARCLHQPDVFRVRRYRQCQPARSGTVRVRRLWPRSQCRHQRGDYHTAARGLRVEACGGAPR
jgi:hypothetical protein